ncbi:hypothetical protein BD289DRAFT_172359 [Coniella lustricola]|uniref:Uncharacterized protein n=1 Tax=Coniella lustricola TaxID=2025994 RepID=A0A2T2ZTV3_9PEZI|nr:hypothetical protein BD289DRAFT_172359 [Coniella lustricola]
MWFWAHPSPLTGTLHLCLSSFAPHRPHSKTNEQHHSAPSQRITPLPVRRAHVHGTPPEEGDRHADECEFPTIHGSNRQEWKVSRCLTCRTGGFGCVFLPLDVGSARSCYACESYGHFAGSFPDVVMQWVEIPTIDVHERGSGNGLSDQHLAGRLQGFEDVVLFHVRRDSFT